MYIYICIYIYLSIVPFMLLAAPFDAPGLGRPSAVLREMAEALSDGVGRLVDEPGHSLGLPSDLFAYEFWPCLAFVERYLVFTWPRCKLVLL
jgi:hypothetical protein